MIPKKQEKKLINNSNNKTMQTNNLNNVKVLFSNSKYNYETNVSSNSTEQTAKEYFVGKYFDLGIYPKEDMQKCIDIEFIDNNKIK